MYLRKTLGLILVIFASGNSNASIIESSSNDAGTIYSNVHITNLYSGYYKTSEGRALLFCAGFSNNNNEPVVSTCELSGWDTTPHEYEFKSKISTLKQHYLTGAKLWIKVKTSWTDPAITKISDKSILSIGTSNGWDFGRPSGE